MNANSLRAAAPIVAFDEAGNTGQDLLNPQQPVFVLSAVCVDEDAARELLRLVARPGAKEAKFGRLRRTASGRAGLCAFLNDGRIRNTTVKVTVYHKPFMVTSKIVDLLIEPLYYEHGLDLYDRAGNLALTNLLHGVTPAFCGKEEFAQLQRLFVRMVRENSTDTRRAFFDHVAQLRRLNRHKPFDDTLELLSATERIAHTALEPADVSALDPAIPAFVDLCARWTHTLQTPFRIIHDASKSMAHARSELELLMTLREAGQMFRAAAYEWQLPILASGVTFEDSKRCLPLQVADLISGAVAWVMTQRVRGGLDGFAHDLASTRVGEISQAAVWPSMAVTPTELRADDRDATRSLEFVIALRDRERARRAASDLRPTV